MIPCILKLSGAPHATLCDIGPPVAILRHKYSLTDEVYQFTQRPQAQWHMVEGTPIAQAQWAAAPPSEKSENGDESFWYGEIQVPGNIQPPFVLGAFSLHVCSSYSIGALRQNLLVCCSILSSFMFRVPMVFKRNLRRSFLELVSKFSLHLDLDLILGLIYRCHDKYPGYALWNHGDTCFCACDCNEQPETFSYYDLYGLISHALLRHRVKS